jgi:hypothetical protein
VTIQSFDSIEYLDTCLYIAGVDGSGLFCPSDWGIDPTMIHTGCWRGYQCGYQLVDGKLLLESVGVGLKSEQHAEALQGRGPVLLGQVPEWIEATGCWLYDGLHLPISFHGRMLVATNWCGDTSGFGGYRRIYEFESVSELVFEKGNLINERDCSPAMRLIRRTRGLSFPPADLDSLDGKIRATMGNWLDDDFRQRLDCYR